MEQLILIVHVLAAVAIIGLIMIQQGKGADMGASFGAGASQTLFGSAGSGNVLTKSTALLATVFFITSFALAVVARDKADAIGQIDLPTVVESRSEMPVADDMPAVAGEQENSPATDVPAAQ